MKQAYYAAAAAVLALLWTRGRKQQAAVKTLDEGYNFADATDWQGGSMWERLAGTDLKLSHAPNLGNTAQADPGRVGLAGSGLVAGWNGNLP